MMNSESELKLLLSCSVTTNDLELEYKLQLTGVMAMMTSLMMVPPGLTWVSHTEYAQTEITVT